MKYERTLRFNTSNADDSKALKILKEAGGSQNRFIIQAIISYAASSQETYSEEKLEKLFRQIIREEIQGLAAKEETISKPEERKQEVEASVNKALDFIGGL